MNSKIHIGLLLLFFMLAGCSGTYHAYYETLKLAFQTIEPTELSLQKVKSSKTDLISVKQGQSPTIVMALAFIENNKHKWISSDKVMLIETKGRIIRTLGLPKNLMYLSNLEEDPLRNVTSLLPFEKYSNEWSFVSDYSTDEYSHIMTSTIEFQSKVNLQELEQDISAYLMVESIQYHAPSNFIRLANSWQNYYWYNSDGTLIKSIQKLSPLSAPLEITYLSRIARLDS